MIDILKTLQFMKPDIKVVIFSNDIDRIRYNETEDFQPTREEILAVDQDAVEVYWAQKVEDEKEQTKAELQAKLVDIFNQIQKL